MNEILEKIKTTTANIFENQLVVPKPPQIYLNKLEAFEEANLDSHRKSLIFEMRCWQAKKMGFQLHTSEEYVKILMGEEHTNDEARNDLERQNHEWFYNHHTDKTMTGENCTWGGPPYDFYRLEKPNNWFLAPFCKKEKWRCRFGKLNYLKREIPYGVVLRMNELKPLNLFNVFSVLAPIEAWQRKTDIDPIVVATIWEIPNDKNAGQVAHFFLAQW